MQIEIGHIYMKEIAKAARLLESRQELLEEAAAWGQFAMDIKEEKFLTEVQCRDAITALSGAIKIAELPEREAFEDALNKVKSQLEEAHKDIDFRYAAELVLDIRNSMTSENSAFLDKGMKKRMQKVIDAMNLREKENAGT